MRSLRFLFSFRFFEEGNTSQRAYGAKKIKRIKGEKTLYEYWKRKSYPNTRIIS